MLLGFFVYLQLNQSGKTWLSTKISNSHAPSAHQVSLHFWSQTTSVGECSSDRAVLVAPNCWRLNGHVQGRVLVNHKKYMWSAEEANVFNLEKRVSLQGVIIRENENTLRAKVATFNIDLQSMDFLDVISTWKENKLVAKSVHIKESVDVESGSMSIDSLRVTADHIQLRDNRPIFRGNVEINRNMFFAVVDEMLVDEVRQVAVLKGIHAVREGQKNIRANELRLNLKTGQWRAIGQVSSTIDI
jgi:lipopolysaccharide export system protein LptA